jgi:hypothetical protein
LQVTQPHTTTIHGPRHMDTANETLKRAGSLRSRSARMRHLLTLAAAAFIAVGCARNQDETGAAPDQGDSTTVTATDTSAAVQTDSTMGQQPSATDTSFVQQDTTAADATMSTDSVGAQGQVQTDSTMTEMPSDTAAPSDSGAAGTSDTTADSTAAQ